MRLLNWRIPLALFFCATLALAPAIAETRAVGQRPRVEHGPGARAAVPHLGITLYSVAGNSGTVPAGISAMPTKAALRRDANLSGIIATAGAYGRG